MSTAPDATGSPGVAVSGSVTRGPVGEGRTVDVQSFPTYTSDETDGVPPITLDSVDAHRDG